MVKIPFVPKDSVGVSATQKNKSHQKSSFHILIFPKSGNIVTLFTEKSKVQYAEMKQLIFHFII